MFEEATNSSVRTPLLDEVKSAKEARSIRFYLSSQSIPPSLPAAIENLPIESWTDFWYRIEPVVRKVELRETIYKTVLLVSLAVWYGYGLLCFSFSPPFSVNDPYFPDDGILFVLQLWQLWLWVPLPVALVVFARLKQASLDILSAFCKEEQQQICRIYGCSLECYYKQGRGLYLYLYFLQEGRGLYLYLYFLPRAAVADELSADERNSYLQIEVWNGSLFASRILLPALDSYKDLPTGFESLSQDDWAKFRSKLIELKRECQSAGRLLDMTIVKAGAAWSMFVLSLSMDGESYPALIFIFILFSLLLLRAFFTAQCCFMNLITKLPRIVAEYADKFTQQGVYIRHRRNPEGGHSIYLFSRTTFECCQNERDFFPHVDGIGSSKVAKFGAKNS
jgi:hypothetical protein